MNRVTFESEGETLVGNLFLPAEVGRGDTLPAVVVGGSWTTVKEQMAGLYARRLAAEGFAALAFDFRFFGESGGEPRQLESAAAKTQDFKNALTFLRTHTAVDPERVGGLAVCAGAGYMARAVAEDERFKSFVAVAAWLQHPETTAEMYGGEEVVGRRVERGEKALDKFREGGSAEYVPAYEPGNKEAAMSDELDYYGNPRRGAVPQWENRFAVASWPEWLRLNVIDGVAEKISAPTLFIHSDGSALPDNVRRFHELLGGPKDLHWSSEGAQIDYYDQEPYVGKAARIAAAHLRGTLA